MEEELHDAVIERMVADAARVSLQRARRQASLGRAHAWAEEVLEQWVGDFARDAARRPWDRAFLRTRHALAGNLTDTLFVETLEPLIRDTAKARLDVARAKQTVEAPVQVDLQPAEPTALSSDSSDFSSSGSEANSDGEAQCHNFSDGEMVEEMQGYMFETVNNVGLPELTERRRGKRQGRDVFRTDRDVQPGNSTSKAPMFQDGEMERWRKSHQRKKDNIIRYEKARQARFSASGTSLS